MYWKFLSLSQSSNRKVALVDGWPLTGTGIYFRGQPGRTTPIIEKCPCIYQFLPHFGLPKFGFAPSIFLTCLRLWWPGGGLNDEVALHLVMFPTFLCFRNSNALIWGRARGASAVIHEIRPFWRHHSKVLSPWLNLPEFSSGIRTERPAKPLTAPFI